MKTKILSVALISTIFIGCSKEESNFTSNSTTQPQENNAARLTDETLLWQTLETKNYTRDENDLPDGIPGNGGATFIIIVQWDEWGRAKKECMGGGLCNAEWFPEFNERLNPDGSGEGDTPPPLKDHAFVVKFEESSQNYYIDILVKYPMPSILPITFSVLPIDADIVLDTQNMLGFDLVLSAGQYSFNQGLEPFGGYRVYLN